MDGFGRVQSEMFEITYWIVLLMFVSAVKMVNLSRPGKDKTVDTFIKLKLLQDENDDCQVISVDGFLKIHSHHST